MNRRSGQTYRQMDRQAVERTDRWMRRKMDTEKNEYIRQTI